MLVLDDIFPEGIQIPESFAGTNIVHLPTMKTHVFTTMTGAMKNAFGGLLHRKRHWTHSVIHETLGGPVSNPTGDPPWHLRGNGRHLCWRRSGSQGHAMAHQGPDSRPAPTKWLSTPWPPKMMGFDPMSIKFIRLAHERGLGCGDISQIDLVGEDISQVNWQFSGVENTFASKGPEADLLGPAEAHRETASTKPPGRPVLPGVQPLPQCLLAEDPWPPPHKGRTGDRMGQAVSVLLDPPQGIYPAWT